MTLSGAATAQVPVTPVISGNQLTARIELPGGLAADLSITFEQVVGLNPAALEITASVVNLADPAIVTRFQNGLVSIPAGFPVVVKIEPTATSALTFSGVYKLGIHTHNLTFQAQSPLRLYRSSGGGPFVDMTGSLEMGSVRAGGSGPGFSEFLIASDVRPIEEVIAQKLQKLESALTTNQMAIAPDVYSDLLSRVQSIRTQIMTGALGPAIDALTAFGAKVKEQSGEAIPDVWQARSSLVNVAGTLRSAADTLRFSVVFKSNG